MKYLSVCSGIEAASVAWGPLGWTPLAFAEVEPFPCAVLAHHWPHVPNLGDMTKINGADWRGQVDVLVGGTPCQAFSVAGLRRGLDDARGSLTPVFAQLADSIDPGFVVWENVPGVLSDKTNAFGCLLGALAGEDDPLVPPGGKWTNAGFVLGPKRAIAWRILDAQYFGVAQRRRRVFLVACPRNGGGDPRAVLFEREGVRRDSAPSRETGQGITSDAQSGLDGCSPPLMCGGSNPASHNARSGHGKDAVLIPVAFQSSQSGVRLVDTHATLDSNNGSRRHNGVLAFGGNNCAGPIDVATARSSSSPHGRLDFETETFCVTGYVKGTNPHSKDEAPTFRETDVAACLNGWDEHHNPPKHLAVAFPANLSGTQCASSEDVAPALGSKNPTAVAFAQNQLGEVRTGEVVNTLNQNQNASGRNTPMIAFQTRGSNLDLGQSVTGTIGVNVDRCSGSAPCVAYSTKLHNTTSNQAGKLYEEYTPGLQQNSPPPALVTPLQVRRLTPRECERLQGFPDDYTLIPWRIWKALGPHPMVASYEAELLKHGMRLREPSTEECPDGPRYKALGNSMAVPCMRWIGQRIQAVATCG